MKDKFPKEFSLYKQYCIDTSGGLGTCHLTNKVANLITSNNYGKSIDQDYMILENTSKALDNLFGMKKEGVIYSPKINSGLFGVPWEKTSDILKEKIRGTNIKWVVWEI
jgi:hypothetical protein